MKVGVLLVICTYLAVALFLMATPSNCQRRQRQSASSLRDYYRTRRASGSTSSLSGRQDWPYPAKVRSGAGMARAGGGAAGGGSPVSYAKQGRRNRKPLLRVPRPESLEEDRRIIQEAEDRKAEIDYQDSLGAGNAFQDSFSSDIQKQTMSDADAQARHYGAANFDGAGLPGGDQRMAFQIHGHQGPLSYRYGFDTGKGYNRQFRYEEKDGHGVVHGRYGYYDKQGKLRIVNYTAHPKHGFAAEGNFGKFP